MIRRVASTRRLLRKKIYRAPHTRHNVNTYFRENKNLVKPHQEKFKDLNGPNIKRRRRPKREVVGGFKRSYRYKYYLESLVEEEIEEIEEELDD